MLSLFPDLLQHSRMNAGEEPLGNGAPVPLRVELERVPRASLQTSAPVGKRDESEFASLSLEKALHVPCVDVSIGAQLVKCRRLSGHSERQAVRRVPHCYRLDERPRGELAMTRGAHFAIYCRARPYLTSSSPQVVSNGGRPCVENEDITQAEP